MAVDAEGCVWAPALFGGVLLRFNSDGTLAQKIEAPTKKPITLVFAGTDLRDLIVVCAKGGGIDGTVYRARTEVPGLPVPKARISKAAH